MRFSAARLCAAAVLAVVIAWGFAPARAAGNGACRAFAIQVHATRSSRAAFREAIVALRAGGLRGLAVRSALADRGDRFVQGFISASDGGTPVEGVHRSTR